MDDYNKEKKRIQLGVTIIAVILIVAYCCYRYYLSMDAPTNTFSVESFYEGKEGTGIDPKTLYSMIYKNTVLDADKCKDTMIAATKPMRTSGGMMWIVDGVELENVSAISSVSTGEAGNAIIKPYSSASNRDIVAPADLTFVNANTEQYSADYISIEAYIGTQYVIRFDDVESWWCHIGMKDPSKHTHIYGNGGAYSRCGAGYVIGRAKPETVVTLYKVDDKGQRSYMNFEELFLK